MENEKIVTMLTEHENRIKVSEHRITDLEDKTDRIESLTLAVNKLASAVEVMANEQNNYRDKQTELTNRILEVERMPDKVKAERHDRIVRELCSLIIGAMFSFLMMALFGFS